MATVGTSNFRERSTVQLVKDLTHQASTLVQARGGARQGRAVRERRAREGRDGREGEESGRRHGRAAAAGTARDFSLSGAFTAFLILVLDGVMPNWAAALCVTALWVLVAVPLALYARTKIQEVGTPVPEKTLESVKEDVAWLKDQTS